MTLSEAELLAKVPTGLYIDGQWVEGRGENAIAVEDPATGKVLLEIANANAQDGLAALAAAEERATKAELRAAREAALEEAARLVENAVRDHFDHFLTDNMERGKALLSAVMERMDDRLRRKAEREMVVRSQALAELVPAEAGEALSARPSARPPPYRRRCSRRSSPVSRPMMLRCWTSRPCPTWSTRAPGSTPGASRMPRHARWPPDTDRTDPAITVVLINIVRTCLAHWRYLHSRQPNRMTQVTDKSACQDVGANAITTDLSGPRRFCPQRNVRRAPTNG